VPPVAVPAATGSGGPPSDPAKKPTPAVADQGAD
jgi:hypothetical protein